MSDSRVIGLHGERSAPVEIRNADDLDGKHVPQLEWVVEHFVPRRNVAMFSGDGGLGKTLMMLQLQVAQALGLREWLGLRLPGKPTATLGVYCEDDQDELHRRLWYICKHYEVSLKALDRLQYICRVNETNNALMKFNSKDYEGVLTGFYHQTAGIIREHAIELTILDNVGNVFSGNQIEKAHVLPFVAALRRLASTNDGGLILCAHPSLSGRASGTGLSGSVAWETAVRARVYVTKPPTGKDDDGDPKPTDERILRVMKSNYGPVGGKIRLVWRNHVIVQHETAASTPYWNE